MVCLNLNVNRYAYVHHLSVLFIFSKWALKKNTRIIFSWLWTNYNYKQLKNSISILICCPVQVLTYALTYVFTIQLITASNKEKSKICFCFYRDKGNQIQLDLQNNEKYHLPGDMAAVQAALLNLNCFPLHGVKKHRQPLEILNNSP